MKSNPCKTVFITGATGFIGQSLCQKLLNLGYTVHAIHRSPAIPFKHPKLHWFRGDVLNAKTLRKALTGCSGVYHLAACATVWRKNKNDFSEINIMGSLNLIEEACKQGIGKILITSTAGVFGPSKTTEHVSEDTKRVVPYFSEYEKTKDKADLLIREKYLGKMHIVTVCPTRVYGPGPLNESNSATKIIKMYAKGKLRFLPGNGKSVGNYVFIDDVVNGMILAMGKGKAGERYLLAGENISFVDFFQSIDQIINRPGKRMIKANSQFLIAIAWIIKSFALMFGVRPIVTPGWAKKYLYHWYVSGKKAQDELGYFPHSFMDGLQKTINWLNL